MGRRKSGTQAGGRRKADKAAVESPEVSSPWWPASDPPVTLPLTVGLFDVDVRVGSVHLDVDLYQATLRLLRDRMAETATTADVKVSTEALMRRVTGVLTMEVFEPFFRDLSDEQFFQQLQPEQAGELVFWSDSFLDRLLVWLKSGDTQSLERLRRGLSVLGGIRRGRPALSQVQKIRRATIRKTVARATTAFCKTHPPIERREYLRSDLIEPLLSEYNLTALKDASNTVALTRSLSRGYRAPSQIADALTSFIAAAQFGSGQSSERSVAAKRIR